MSTDTLLLPGPPPLLERLQMLKDLIPLRKPYSAFLAECIKLTLLFYYSLRAHACSVQARKQRALMATSRL